MLKLDVLFARELYNMICCYVSNNTMDILNPEGILLAVAGICTLEHWLSFLDILLHAAKGTMWPFSSKYQFG